MRKIATALFASPSVSSLGRYGRPESASWHGRVYVIEVTNISGQPLTMTMSSKVAPTATLAGRGESCVGPPRPQETSPRPL